MTYKLPKFTPSSWLCYKYIPCVYNQITLRCNHPPVCRSVIKGSIHMLSMVKTPPTLIGWDLLTVPEMKMNRTYWHTSTVAAYITAHLRPYIQSQNFWSGREEVCQEARNGFTHWRLDRPLLRQIHCVIIVTSLLHPQLLISVTMAVEYLSQKKLHFVSTWSTAQSVVWLIHKFSLVLGVIKISLNLST